MKYLFLFLLVFNLAFCDDFGNDKRVGIYDYTTWIKNKKDLNKAQEEFQISSQKCNEKNDIDSCYEANFLWAGINNEYESFFNNIVPKFCYEGKFAKACIAKIEFFEFKFYPHYEKFLLDPENTKMVTFSCETLQDSLSCEWLGKIYEAIGNKNESKKYFEKSQSLDSKSSF